eukprot:TRINITY_DN13178_c0_g5_i2.p1 TRINITY_DN13178_c0_g5~~TRINITY_DN13178_c0_g5_i2.p1  ORF type:complete len:386 (+),score=37.32 TRINITY_DN13178_c0_g5_i2:151-1308(+)
MSSRHVMESPAVVRRAVAAPARARSRTRGSVYTPSAASSRFSDPPSRRLSGAPHFGGERRNSAERRVPMAPSHEPKRSPGSQSLPLPSGSDRRRTSSSRQTIPVATAPRFLSGHARRFSPPTHSVRKARGAAPPLELPRAGRRRKSSGKADGGSATHAYGLRGLRMLAVAADGPKEQPTSEPGSLGAFMLPSGSNTGRVLRTLIRIGNEPLHKHPPETPDERSATFGASASERLHREAAVRGARRNEQTVHLRRSELVFGAPPELHRIQSRGVSTSPVRRPHRRAASDRSPSPSGTTPIRCTPQGRSQVRRGTADPHEVRRWRDKLEAERQQHALTAKELVSAKRELLLLRRRHADALRTKQAEIASLQREVERYRGRSAAQTLL